MPIAKLACVVVVVVACARPAQVSVPNAEPLAAVVIVSANAEWKVVKAMYPAARYHATPWGEYFEHALAGTKSTRIVMFHGGWGKVAAAGSAQYAIDRWKPRYVLNLGTAGGIAGAIERHAVVLADRTVIYDIEEAMGDSAEAIAEYSVAIDLSWLQAPLPSVVTRTLLVSGDRDLVPAQVGMLVSKYRAIAGDWESGAIAYTCARNKQRVLILRGISDLVSPEGGEAYGDPGAFTAGANVVMRRLLGELPAWVDRLP